MQPVYFSSRLKCDTLLEKRPYSCDTYVQHSRQTRLRRECSCLAGGQVHQSRGRHHCRSLKKLIAKRPTRLLRCADKRYLWNHLPFVQAWHYSAQTSESRSKWIPVQDDLATNNSAVFLHHERVHDGTPLQLAFFCNSCGLRFAITVLLWRYNARGLRIWDPSSHLWRVQIQQDSQSRRLWLYPCHTNILIRFRPNMSLLRSMDLELDDGPSCWIWWEELVVAD